MLNYEAIWPLTVAKKTLKDCSFSSDPEKSKDLSEKVQDAIDLALLIVNDFNEAQNEAYDVGWQSAAGQLKGLDWHDAELVERVLSPHPLAIGDLKKATPGQWLWIDFLSPDFRPLCESAYFQVTQSATPDKDFLPCSWPGSQQLVCLPYAEYGHGWLAYPHKPKEVSQ